MKVGRVFSTAGRTLALRALQRLAVPLRVPRGSVARWADASGAGLAEFAVAATILIGVIFGIIECALGLYTYNYVCDAARTATRYAVVRGSSCTQMPDCGITSSQIQTLLRGIPYPGITPGNLTATTTWYSASASQPTSWTACGSQCNAPGNAVRVQVSYSFPLHLPFYSNASINIGSSSRMVISN